MAYAAGSVPIYAKGTMDVWLFNPYTFDLDYYSDKVQTNSLTTSVNMGEINGSLRNPVLLNLPDSAALELEITNAVSTLESRKMSVGGELTYNGIYPVIETITAFGGELTVGVTPAAPYGTSAAYCFIDKSGTAYTIDTGTKRINNFTPEEGKTYCVRYFARAASARQLKIESVFNPDIEICMIRIPLYTTAAGRGAKYGIRWGDRYIWIPRLQNSGEINANGNQTDADAETLRFRALPYEEALDEGICLDESSFALAYMVDIPIEGPWALVEGIAVPGGGVTVPLYESVKVPFVYVMSDGSLVPIPNDEQFTDFTVEVVWRDGAGSVMVTQTRKDGVQITAVTPATDHGKALIAIASKEVGLMPNAGEKECDLIDLTTTEFGEGNDDGYILWSRGDDYVVQDGSEIGIDEDGYLTQTYDDGAGYSEAALNIDADGDLAAAQTNNAPRIVMCEFTITVV